MQLELELTLVPRQGDPAIPIQPAQSNQIFLQDQPQVILLRAELDYHNLPDHISILSVGAIPVGSGARIQITQVRINGEDTEDSIGLFRFQVRGTPYVQDHTQTNTWEIAHSGRLELVVRQNRDRLCWCPAYHSATRAGFVFDNSLLNWPTESPEIRPYQGDPRPRHRVWQNQPHLPQDPAPTYPLAVFGCSITWGTGMPYPQTWSPLIEPGTLNLATPGAGWDSVLLNLVAAESQFRWDRTCILLPNLQRRVVRLPVSMTGGWARIPVGISTLDWFHTQFKRWAWRRAGTLHTTAEIEQWRRSWEHTALRVITEPAQPRALRLLHRMIRHLASRGRPYWFSSWDTEAYSVLQQSLAPEHLLPPFQQTDHCQDRLHPGPESHRRWAEQIRPIIAPSGNW